MTTTTTTAPRTAAILATIREALAKDTMTALRLGCHTAGIDLTEKQANSGRAMKALLGAVVAELAPTATPAGPAPVLSADVYRLVSIATGPERTGGDMRRACEALRIPLTVEQGRDGGYMLAAIRAAVAGGPVTQPTTVVTATAPAPQVVAQKPAAPVAVQPGAERITRQVTTPQAVDSKATQPVQTVTHEGDVKHPEQTPSGNAPRLFVRQSTTAGMVYAVASVWEAVAYAVVTATEDELAVLVEAMQCEVAAKFTPVVTPSEPVKVTAPIAPVVTTPTVTKLATPAPAPVKVSAAPTVQMAAQQPAAPKAAPAPKAASPAADKYSGLKGYHALRRDVQAAEGLADLPKGDKAALLVRLSAAPKTVKPAQTVSQAPIAPVAVKTLAEATTAELTAALAAKLGVKVADLEAAIALLK